MKAFVPNSCIFRLETGFPSFYISVFLYFARGIIRSNFNEQFLIKIIKTLSVDLMSLAWRMVIMTQRGYPSIWDGLIGSLSPDITLKNINNQLSKEITYPFSKNIDRSSSKRLPSDFVSHSVLFYNYWPISSIIIFNKNQ